MESPTFDAMMQRPAGREALHAALDGMGVSDLVVRYAFWHLDEKRNGRLSGQVESGPASMSPLQFIEMVVEQAQADLLVGAARKHQASERAALRAAEASFAPSEQQPARRPQRPETRSVLPPPTHRQKVASKWRVVTEKRQVLAEASADWSPNRVVAWQTSIANALLAWQACVDQPD